MVEDLTGDDPEELALALLEQDKPQQAILVLTIAAIEAQIAVEGWDRAPWLYLIYRNMPPTELADQLQVNYGQAAQLMAVKPLGMLPVESSAHLTAALYGLSERFAGAQGRLFEPMLGEDMIAWALTNEGWMVSAPEGGPMPEDMRRAARAHTLDTHPQRREVRIITAVDRTLARYQLTRVRDGGSAVILDESALPDEEAIVDGTTKDGAQLAGGIFAALTTLMANTP